ncbi:MAG: hypothetical protein VX938_03740 [Myxococcota bacterium]|nr:hypothetical protein [Myxococcota bacterium]
MTKPSSFNRWSARAVVAAGLLVTTACASSTAGSESEEATVATDVTSETAGAGAGAGEAGQWTFVPPATDGGPEPKDSDPDTNDDAPEDGSGNLQPNDAGPEPDPEDGGTGLDDTGAVEDGTTTPPEDSTEPSADIAQDAEEGATDEGGPGADDIEDPPEDAEPADPCEALDCSTPPKSLCEGHVAVTYPQGECVVTDEGAECQYPPVSKDCFETGGQFCEDGACVGCSSDQQCNDVLAPSVGCEGDYTALYMSWKCDDGACISVTVSSACDGSGTMSCADDLIQWTLPECVESVGSIEVILDDEVDCGALGLTCLELEEPTCVDPGDVCLTEDECKTPPVSLCDGNTAISYPAQGDCQGNSGLTGVCVYNHPVTT